MNPSDYPYRQLFPEDSNSADGKNTPVGERLDDLYQIHRNTEELQTTEIPISMLMALDKLSQTKSESSTTINTTLPSMSNQNTLEVVDQKTLHSVTDLSGHLKRVAAYARLLAIKYGMDEKEADFVQQISPMHDIGKWAIPEAILHKPSALTPDEWEIMKTHTSMGYEMLKDSKLDVLRMGALVAIEHQEKYDGTGYPKGLKGEEIHIYSRITTVADVFDALGSVRTYKEAWDVVDIIRYFKEGRDTHFDPKLVDLLLENIQEFINIRIALP